jgi:polar amino acid transport system substrate-binding protein
VANTVENGLKMLVHNHVDVFVSNRRNTDPVIARLGYGRQVKPLPRVVETQNGYFAFPVRQPSTSCACSSTRN